ncbi:MAG: hypothetical protein PHU06_10775 [Gallionella sp.]|nr:hypothetical protein [Gallionella sp.]MDD4960166.1 hypothetical protein [Gallionella sp.]
MRKMLIYFLIQSMLLMFSWDASAASDSNSVKKENSAEIQAVENAALKYALAHCSFSRLHVTLQKIIGDYAKLTVSPIEEEGDVANVYMKKVNDEWIGIDIGTGTNPMELGLPKEVW